MILRILFTKHILELLMITLSAYILLKARHTRGVNAATKAFCGFAAANVLYQITALCTALYREGDLLSGRGFGHFSYVLALVSMALCAYLWLNYVEEALGPRMLRTHTRKLLWAVPLAVFAVLCALSPKTGWLYAFDGNGRYGPGSLFFLQYVFIFGYTAVAMSLSAGNFIRAKEKRATDRVLLTIMLIDAAAAALQLVYGENYMNIALTLTALLAYVNVYSAEVRAIRESAEQELLAREKDEAERLALAENNTRILALEDDFEVLYDVELETGRYGIFVKGQSFGDVTLNLINNNSFFDDVEKNLNVVHPDDRQGNYDTTRPEFIREALAKDDHFDRYYRLMVKGEPRWARMRIVYKNEEKKNIIIGVFNAEEEILAREKDERRILLNYFIGAYESAFFVNLAENKFEILHMNPAFAKFFAGGWDAADSMRRFITQYVVPEDRAVMVHAIDKETVMARLKEEPSFSFTVRENLDGAEKMLRVQVIRMADEAHIAVSFMDVTQEVQEQQKRLLGAVPLSNDVLAKASIGLWAFELDEGQPPRMYGDEAMLKLVGLEQQVPPEQMYHAWYDQIDEGSYGIVADAVAKMTSGEHAEVQYPWHYPDGRTVIVRCGGVRNPEYTKGIRVEGTHQDVTQTLHFDEEQRRREEQQRQDEIARIKAESSDKAKTEFLFNMSHDIRTPMNAILGYTDIALKHIGEPGKVEDSLKKIRMSGGHLLQLINDILEMSRIEAGKLEIVNRPLNIHEVTEGVVAMSRALAETKDITFSARIGELKNDYIYADELHINQIIINLISNAVKYTNPGGTVEYSIDQLTEPEDGSARYRVTVRDTGIGMSEAFQQHLFESFSREQTSTVSRQEGAGLGLAIVKRIVDIIGGTIAVSSRKDEGSVFTVELPVRVMDDEAIARFTAERGGAEDAEGQVSLAGRRVLLTEDNEMNREIAAELLEEAGLIVETAENGAAAVEKVTENGAGYYDFILMDIQMPVMNGYEATAAIRKLPGGDRVPIIALSANAFEEDKRKSLEAGMNAHVAKPIDVKTLFGVIEEYL